MKKYSWNFDEYSEIWGNETYDTIQECIEDAREESKFYGDEYKRVYIGENIPFIPVVNAEAVLDALQEDAAEQMGEIGGDWSAYKWDKHDEIDELKNELTKTTFAWLVKYGYSPKMWRIVNIKSYSLFTDLAG